MIERATSNVVDKLTNGQDPITGIGPVGRTYLNENLTVLEEVNSKDKDYSINVFSAMGHQLYTMYHNNMITPVTNRSHLDYNMLSNVMGETVRDGVYIVERYALGNLPKRHACNLLEYYVDARGIAYDDNCVEEVKKRIRSTEHRKRGMRAIELRIVTYVPKDTVLDNHYTYVTGPGIVIINGDIPDNMVHPYSPYNLETTVLMPEVDPSSVGIDISIVDSDNKPYYFRLGNKTMTVRPVTSKANELLPKGCTITTRRGNGVTEDEFVPTNKFEERGFYRSKELCESQGDLSLMVDLEKHRISKDKLALERDKLRDSIDKLKLEHKQRTEMYEMEICRKRLDFTYYVLTKKITLIADGAKAIMEIKAKDMAMSITTYKYELDMIRLNTESKLSNVSNVIKAVDLTIKAISTILK